MSVVLMAAIIGGISSSLRFYKQGFVAVLRIFLSSAAFAYFAGEDLADFANEYSQMNISVGVSCFLLSYCASTILDRIIILISSIQVNKKWGS